MKKAFFVCMVAFFLFLPIFFVFTNNVSTSCIEQSFVLDEPFLMLIKDLAKKDSFEKIIEQNDAILVDKTWNYLEIDLPKKILRIREYQMNGELKFTIQKHDESLGNIELKFIQIIHLDKDLLKVNIHLIKEHKNVILYNKILEIRPMNQYSSNIYIKSELKIKKFIPFFAKNYMNEKVKKNNEKDVILLKNNLKKLTKSQIKLKL
jgi:hypothetical protein